MSDLMTAIYHDIQHYVHLCRIYRQKVRYKKEAYGTECEDCYGAHAEKLNKRFLKEQKQKDKK